MKNIAKSLTAVSAALISVLGFTQSVSSAPLIPATSDWYTPSGIQYWGDKGSVSLRVRTTTYDYQGQGLYGTAEGIHTNGAGTPTLSVIEIDPIEVPANFSRPPVVCYSYDHLSWTVLRPTPGIGYALVFDNLLETHFGPRTIYIGVAAYTGKSYERFWAGIPIGPIVIPIGATFGKDAKSYATAAVDFQVFESKRPLTIGGALGLDANKKSVLVTGLDDKSVGGQIAYRDGSLNDFLPLVTSERGEQYLNIAAEERATEGVDPKLFVKPSQETLNAIDVVKRSQRALHDVAIKALGPVEKVNAPKEVVKPFKFDIMPVGTVVRITVPVHSFTYKLEGRVKSEPIDLKPGQVASFTYLKWIMVEWEPIQGSGNWVRAVFNDKGQETSRTNVEE